LIFDKSLPSKIVVNPSAAQDRGTQKNDRAKIDIIILITQKAYHNRLLNEAITHSPMPNIGRLKIELLLLAGPMRLQPFPAKSNFLAVNLKFRRPSTPSQKNGSGENPKPFHKGCLIAEDY
jgi:hypothetical protein